MAVLWRCASVSLESLHYHMTRSTILIRPCGARPRARHAPGKPVASWPLLHELRKQGRQHSVPCKCVSVAAAGIQQGCLAPTLIRIR